MMNFIMNRWSSSVTCIIIFILQFYLMKAKKTNKKDDDIYDEPLSTDLKAPTSAASETNVVNFFRLFIMRMVYGFAKMIGIGDFLEDFAGGIFAPPEPDYDGFDYGAADDDYDY